MPKVNLGPEPLVEANVLLRNAVLGAYTHIQAHSVLHEVVLGDYSYCAGYNQIDYAAIGKFCSIASFVRINPGNHPTYTRVAQHHFTYRSSDYGMGEDDKAFFDWRRSRPVTIGNDVWIGHNASILPGVIVGNGAVIGTGAVVTRDVAPYSIVAGVPAGKIGMRFPEGLIERIEASRWWDWDYDTLKERLPDFRDLDTFIYKYL
ncbi:DapH/DapD/GlmU-related protein [Papillibacter cinnamivorans]|uniref:Phosphonate metabolim protein, transferase hexapeptide repeat family n=1 Tax=Papillibacter cinnamivorans DSM 12816 TaxID=1122930 RepID=A0A1W2BB79_9FIRM|nr:DapH/DapD/GlmU-related protein [Papillibacter cinnamivorans]SMC70225.1 hypothetical protein SAMN02745168_2127 [Papillibacter cinnamivorans DSM 12816]